MGFARPNGEGRARGQVHPLPSPSLPPTGRITYVTLIVHVVLRVQCNKPSKVLFSLFIRFSSIVSSTEPNTTYIYVFEDIKLS